MLLNDISNAERLLSGRSRRSGSNEVLQEQDVNSPVRLQRGRCYSSYMECQMSYYATEIAESVNC